MRRDILNKSSACIAHLALELIADIFCIELNVEKMRGDRHDKQINYKFLILYYALCDLTLLSVTDVIRKKSS